MKRKAGDVAQMVERSLSMREVRGSIPCISSVMSVICFVFKCRYRYMSILMLLELTC